MDDELRSEIKTALDAVSPSPCRDIKTECQKLYKIIVQLWAAQRNWNDINPRSFWRSLQRHHQGDIKECLKVMYSALVEHQIDLIDIDALSECVGKTLATFEAENEFELYDTGSATAEFIQWLSSCVDSLMDAAFPIVDEKKTIKSAMLAVATDGQLMWMPRHPQRQTANRLVLSLALWSACGLKVDVNVAAKFAEINRQRLNAVNHRAMGSVPDKSDPHALKAAIKRQWECQSPMELLGQMHSAIRSDMTTAAILGRDIGRYQGGTSAGE